MPQIKEQENTPEEISNKMYVSNFPIKNLKKQS